MKVNGNQMNAIPFLVFSVVVSGSLGGYAGYPGYHQPIPAPYFPFPYNVAAGPATLPLAVAPPPALRFAAPLPANLPQHYYTPPGNTYSGFSYETDYPNGGSSQVVFVTGPQSRQLMQRSFESFRRFKPDQAKLRVLTVTPTPETKLRVLTVAPTLETNSTPATTTADLESISVSSQTPEPLPNSVPLSLPNAVFTGNPTASVYRVQIFPSHIPQYPHYLQAPFPYHPIFTSFYNAVPQVNATSNIQPTGMQGNTNNSPMQQENANDGQESMINEVGAIPVLVTNRIDSPTPIPAEEPASTAQTLSTEPLNSSPVPVVTSVPETSSTEAGSSSSQEPITMEAAVTTSAPELSSTEAVTTSAPELSSTAAVTTSAPELSSTEAVTTSALELSSTEAVTTSAPELSSTEAVTTSSQESLSLEAVTTQAQGSSSIEALTLPSVDTANRIQAEASTEATEEVTTLEDAPSTGGEASETSETTSTASVSEETIMPAATTVSSANSSMDEQTTVEQTTTA